MTLAETLPARTSAPNRLSFTLKVVLAAGLAILADIGFDSGASLLDSGSVAGMLALLWLTALLICHRQMRTNRASHFALIGAGLAAAALLYEPGFVAAVLFPAYLGLALFLPRYDGFDSALRWLARLVLYGILSPLTLPLFDLPSIGRTRRGRQAVALLPLLGALAIAGVGSLLFLVLFSEANPLISRSLGQTASALSTPGFLDFAGDHLLFLAIMLVVLWGSFRPLHLRLLVRRVPGLEAEPARRAWVGTVTIVPALASFNLVFALQNLTDLCFLWGGAKLPEGMTFSDYAHKGTHVLIAAALLAAIFVLAFLRTGSALSANRTVRALVYAFIGQTIFLVFSSMERTLNYIEAYSLTYTRLNALVFMTLVATGLVLISWRIAKGRSGVWLINANALCLAVVLALVSFTNYDAVIARWNLVQSASAAERVVQLDTEYLDRLEGSGTLLPLIEVTADPAHASGGLTALRRRTQLDLEAQQADWRRWTIAGFWRLRAAGALSPPSGGAAGPNS
jgi:Domain of unknown function (DUF4173)